MGNKIKQYCFYGWENADIKPMDEKYAAIESPRVLYDILSGLWCAETCAPRMREEWTVDNKTMGHCFDLTSEQFGDEKLDYENNPKQSREVHFAKEEKRLRYEFLRDGLNQRLIRSYNENL